MFSNNEKAHYFDDNGLKKQRDREMIFISYSHEDEEHLERLRIHMKPLEKRGLVVIWDDSKIITGQKWQEKIETALSKANIAILIISADFFASDFIAEKELPPILKKAESEGTMIVPIILKPCRFLREEHLSKFQALNHPDEPLLSMSDIEQEKTWDRLSQLIETELRRPDEEAILNYTEKIGTNNNDELLYFRRGVCYKRLGKFHEAISDFLRAKDIEPKDRFVYFELGDCYKKLHKYLDSIKNYLKCLEFEPDPKPILNKLGLILKDLGGEHFDFSGLTALDKKLRLRWVRNANLSPKRLTWDEANHFLQNLNIEGYAGYNDWRLPDIGELVTLISFVKNIGYEKKFGRLFNKMGFNNVQSTIFWSNEVVMKKPNWVYAINMNYGGKSRHKKIAKHCIWPVRSEC